MLIQRTPDIYEKLQHLGGMATDDILDGSPRPAAAPDRRQRGGVTPHAGVYRAAMPNGKRISLMRVMFTHQCDFDCHYCPNSYWVPRKRYGFKVDELARLFDEITAATWWTASSSAPASSTAPATPRSASSTWWRQSGNATASRTTSTSR